MQLLISNDQSRVEVGDELLSLMEKVVAEALKGREFPGEPEVSLVLVDDERMAELNRRYRGVDGPTDVLSFPMLEEGEDDPDAPGSGEEVLLGDIVISVPRALAQAEMYGHSLERELAFLTVHGMLHLLGYDHRTPEEEAEMRRRQREVLAGVGIGEEQDA